MSDRFEQAFIQCLKDGVYPGPSNINERYRADTARFNRLNGQKTKERLALMYLFGVPYQRGPMYSRMTYGGYEVPTSDLAGTIPEWPYFYEGDWMPDDLKPPVQGSRKHEIQYPYRPWKLRRK